MKGVLSGLTEADSLRPFVSTECWDESNGEESTGSRLLREARVLTYGIGGSFADVARNPMQRAPELALACGFGMGMRVLSKAGAPGRIVAGAIGTGLLAKMAVDEFSGDRWSRFGSAMNSAWRSEANLDSAVLATRDSVGSLAVDFSIGALGFGFAGKLLPESNFSHLSGLRGSQPTAQSRAAHLLAETSSTARTGFASELAAMRRSGTLRSADILAEEVTAGSRARAVTEPLQVAPAATDAVSATSPLLQRTLS